MTPRNVIVETATLLLVDRGFKRVGSTFHKDLSGLTAVLNLQRSQFGAQYYMNLAWYDPTLIAGARPKEHQCHVRLRVGNVPGVEELQSKEALDLEIPLDEETREAAITELIGRACAFLESGASTEALRGMHGRGELRGAAILRTMQPRLRS